MRIWVRSQDGEILCECTSFTADTSYSEGIESGYYVDGAEIDGTVFELGFYSSKEKALNVLDEIQECINEPIYTNVLVNEYAHYGRCVFQMPQDEEVDI